jgi:hypothetical protein
VELFAHDRVVLLPAGIGTAPPRAVVAGRIVRARCYGPVATLDRTGLVFVRAGVRATVGDLFATWGKPLRPGRMGDFLGRVAAFVAGRRWHGSPRSIPLARHVVIVLEVGRRVPPHSAYFFPAGLR